MSPMPHRALPSSLATLVEGLGLDPARAELSWSPRADGYVVLPSPRRPHLLVPTGVGGATMLRERHSRRRTVAAARRVAAVGLAGRTRGWRAPWPRLVLTDPAWDELQSLLGADPAIPQARPGVMLGPPRANRKPVFRVFDAEGSTVAFAKMGLNELTDELVGQEASALRQVARLELRGIEVPPVLDDRRWRGRRLLLIGALTGAGGPRQTTRLPEEATRELSERGADEVPLAALDLMSSAAGPVTGVLGAARDTLLTTHADTRVPVGASHGDWSPWNMAWAGDRLQVWDWERFEVGVPRGFDAIHFLAGRVRVDPDGAQGEQEFWAAVPGALVAVGVDPALHRLMLVLYLLRIGLRYHHDLDREFSTPVRRRLSWVEAGLERELRELAR